MIDPDKDPILNASSINSEDYWFLKVSGVESNDADTASSDVPKTDCAAQENAPAKDKA